MHNQITDDLKCLFNKTTVANVFTLPILNLLQYLIV